MGTQSPQELLRQWRLEHITVEMATGHILQNMVQFGERLDSLSRSLHRLRVDVAHMSKPATDGCSLPENKHDEPEGNVGDDESAE